MIALALSLLAAAPDAGRPDGGTDFSLVLQGSVDDSFGKKVAELWDAGLLGVNPPSIQKPAKPTYSDLSGKLPRVALDVSRPTVRGALDPDVVKMSVRRNQNQARYCHELQLKKTPELSGTVDLEWEIDGNGRVPAAKSTGGTIKSPELAACIAARMKTWVFPKPGDGKPVTAAVTLTFGTK